MLNKGYSQEFIEKLKSANDIIGVISSYIHVEKKGKSFWACCPFHHEKTPSFCINEYEQYYHCFGCKESGDVISFVMKYENLDYPEAVKTLAERAGMEIPTQNSEDDKYIELKREKDVVLEILNLAKEHYKSNLYLPAAKVAQNYVKLRGFGKRELDNFEIGASLNWTECVKYLLSMGKSVEDIAKAGICALGKDGQPYDVYGGRLIFPIINANGDCIAFSARDLTGTSQAKYKNTVQTVVFDKSQTVYGINLVKKQKQTEGIENIIIVEGQIDVIAMHKAGFKQTVACLGTALTFKHAKELKRFTNNVILCLDGDFAGQKASLRSIPILETAGMNVKVAIMPEGLDPDEFLKKYGVEKLKDVLAKAVPTTDFKMLCVKRKYNLNEPAEKAKYAQETLAILRELKTEAEKDVYLKVIRDNTGIPLDVLRRDLFSESTQVEVAITEKTITSNSQLKAEAYVLGCLISGEEFAFVPSGFDKVLSSVGNKIYGLFQDKQNQDKKLHLTTLFDYFSQDEPEIQEIINFSFQDVGNRSQYYRECMWLLCENFLKQTQTQLTKKFKEETTSEGRKIILSKLGEITKQLRNKNLEDFNA